jgi:hypothetical protein
MSSVSGSYRRFNPPILRVSNQRCARRRADDPMGGCSIEAGLLPQLSGNGERIKLDQLPPCRLVAPAMEHTMVGTAKRNHELVADPAAQRARLGKSQVVGVRRPASAQQARLRGYELQVRAIAVAPRFAMRKSAFVDMANNGCGCLT